jgi:hypothetical protein
MSEQIKLDEYYEKQLESLIEKVGVEYVRRLAGSGRMFIPEQVSLHLYVSKDVWGVQVPGWPAAIGINFIQMKKGLVMYDELSFYGEIILPRTLPDKDRESLSINYDLITGAMRKTGILVKDDLDDSLVLKLDDKKDLTVVYKDFRQPLADLGIGFPSPIKAGGQGMIGFSINPEQTLKLYARIYSLEDTVKKEPA